MSSAPEPTEALAAEIAQRKRGQAPTSVRRFATGAQHYVYEAVFEAGPALVVRLSRTEDRAVAQSAARLSRWLRPLGAPLPELIEDGSAAPVPYLLLERLEGEDLGAVAAGLGDAALETIAARVADAQGLVGRLRSVGRYGYAASPELAPFERWQQVLSANVARSRERIAAAGLFDGSAPDEMDRLIAGHAGALARIAATPFLHDTTTKNVIVTRDGRFSGIVDVDDLCFGDPRYVAALTLASVLAGEGARGPALYVEALMRRAGWRADPLFRLYVALFLADFMGEQGQTLNGNPITATPEARARLEALFRRVAAGAAA